MKRQRVVFSWDKDGNEPIDETVSLDEPIKIGETREVEIWIQAGSAKSQVLHEALDEGRRAIDEAY